MTFTLPGLITIGCFLVPIMIGGIASILNKDLFYTALGAFAGIILGAFGFMVGILIDGTIADSKIKKAAHVEQSDHFESMPQDWQNLHHLLNETAAFPLKKAYVREFVKNKTESKLSAEAYELSSEAYKVFYTTLNGSKDYSYHSTPARTWRWWVADKIAPFVLIDLKRAMKEIANRKPK